MRALKYVLILAIGCTKHVAGVYCTSDGDCTSPGLTFCDVGGQYPESGYQANTCSAPPINCPVERCGCQPGASLSCSASMAMQCGSDGMSAAAVACPLGCSLDGTRCATFEPSNGLGSSFEMAAQEPSVTIVS